MCHGSAGRVQVIAHTRLISLLLCSLPSKPQEMGVPRNLRCNIFLQLTLQEHIFVPLYGTSLSQQLSCIHSPLSGDPYASFPVAANAFTGSRIITLCSSTFLSIPNPI